MRVVPLTAWHPDLGVLDVTRTDEGGRVPWAQVHKVKPRAPLSCRECAAAVHAKESVRGQRFFAHDAGSSCPSSGESVAHRLLKTELAAAIRAAGWVAELEVPGTGWRADVLATSPDGTRRVAWEAQLAPATVADLQQRTDTMLTELDAVCWVTDRDVPWVCRVPSLRLHRDETTGELMVVAGAARFAPDWCTNKEGCRHSDRHERRVCVGHGRWVDPAGLTLAAMVAAVCRDLVRSMVVDQLHVPTATTRHPGGSRVWTTRTHRDQAAAQAQAHEQRQHEERLAEQELLRWQQNREALEQRQLGLLEPARQLLRTELGDYPQVVVGNAQDLEWGGGVPLRVGGQVRAVVCPVASRITSEVRDRLRTVVVVVATERERDRVAAHCMSRTRFEILAVEPVPERPVVPHANNPLSQALRRMTYGGR